jgi:hypothetical protein
VAAYWRARSVRAGRYPGGHRGGSRTYPGHHTRTDACSLALTGAIAFGQPDTFCIAYAFAFSQSDAGADSDSFGVTGTIRFTNT